MVEERVACAEQNGTPASIIFIDVNGMKAVNDTYGHIEGDRLIDDISGLLCAVSHTLRLTDKSEHDGRKLNTDLIGFSSNDPGLIHPAVIENEPGRIGGDEFTVYADTDEAGCQRIIERVRASFIEYINHPKNTNLKELGIGIAVGHASLQPGMTAAELTKLADEAMYVDKKSQLPELTPEQRRLLFAAQVCLKHAGLTWRDAIKYLD